MKHDAGTTVSLHEMVEWRNKLDLMRGEVESLIAEMETLQARLDPDSLLIL